jgi:hypothetical protein
VYNITFWFSQQEILQSNLLTHKKGENIMIKIRATHSADGEIQRLLSILAPFKLTHVSRSYRQKKREGGRFNTYIYLELPEPPQDTE